MSESQAARHFLFSQDGMAMTSAEKWIRLKVSIITEYLTAFVGHVSGKVDDIIFVDLFAGNGLYALGARQEIFPSTALKAMASDIPVSKFVLCESDPERYAHLKIRINKHFRNKNVVLLEGRPEDLIDRIKMYVPKGKGKYKSATFCLVDPFSLELPFTTIQRLAEEDFTFLIPFTFALNEQLDFTFYLTEQRRRLEKFMGDNGIARLEQGLEGNVQFYKKLVNIYESNMLSIGLNGATSVHRLDSGLMEVPLYQMGLFSRQVSTKFIQQEVESAHHVQFQLFNA